MIDLSSEDQVTFSSLEYIWLDLNCIDPPKWTNTGDIGSNTEVTRILTISNMYSFCVK